VAALHGARENAPAFEAIRDRASARGLKVSAGRVLPIYGAGAEDALHFRDPDGHVVEVVASPMPAEV